MSATNRARRERIREYLIEHRNAGIQELVEYLNSSEATVRRDIQELSKEAGFQRTRGGIVVDGTASELSVAQRGYIQADKKQLIGKRAASLINDGDVVFLGSGSTVVEVARNLGNHQNLTVITNSLPVVTTLADNTKISLLVAGGALRRPEMSFIGHVVQKALSEMRADKAFMGIQGIHPEHGLTNEHLPETILDRFLVHFAPQLFLVADSTKLGKIKASYVGAIEDVNTLITDSAGGAEQLTELRRRGVKIILADRIE
ncbi:DeoR/GlpR family DNA-binding transcription regulator [Salinispira pacifica]